MLEGSYTKNFMKITTNVGRKTTHPQDLQALWENLGNLRKISFCEDSPYLQLKCIVCETFENW